VLKVGNRKAVVVLVDGLGDLPIASLGGETPLEAAHTPLLNRLAASGSFGLVDPLGRGQVPSTHSGTGVIFGIDADDTQKVKRGPVEASGAGRVLEPGDVAVRANFATLEPHGRGFRVLDRRAGRIISGTVELAAELAHTDLGDGITGGLQPTDQHRCVLVLSGPGLHPDISDTDPGDGADPPLLTECRPLVPAAELTAAKINRFSRLAFERLRHHPVNRERIEAGLLPASGIITRGAGGCLALDNPIQARGIETAVIAGCNTIRGLARLIGFSTVSDPRFTADAQTDLGAKMSSAREALRDHELVYVHVKAPDLFSHDLQPQGKLEFLERLDESLAILLGEPALIAVVADHSTDSNLGVHTADPVPALISDLSTALEPAEDPVNFGESACRRGNMPRQVGHDYLLRLIDSMGY
jgi:2,3-bisphosphoglycerate-independent phosphoglycerate mutase